MTRKRIEKVRNKEEFFNFLFQKKINQLNCALFSHINLYLKQSKRFNFPFLKQAKKMSQSESKPLDAPAHQEATEEVKTSDAVEEKKTEPVVNPKVAEA